MSNDTIHKVNGRIVNEKAVESKILQYKQFIVEADTMFCAKSLLIWLGVISLLDPNVFILAIHDCFFVIRAYSTADGFFNLNTDVSAIN